MKIGIIGVGKLGLAYALAFEQSNFEVIASSYKSDYVKDLQQKIINTSEPGIKELLTNSKHIEFTTDNHRVIEQSDFIYVMVATPSTDAGDYDVSAVFDATRDFLTYPKEIAGKILVVGSTVNPGTCERIQDMLAPRGVHVVYSPTFVAQGSVLRDIHEAHTLSIGTEDKIVADKCRQIFSKISADDTLIYVMKPLTAEILKLAGNCRATLMISYINTIGQILLEQDLASDLDTACQYLRFIKLEHKPTFGFGYGGPCYPRDNRAFVHYAQRIGMDYPLGRLVDDFNNKHVDWLTNYFISDNKNNLPFYFSYVTYKKNVNILEESHQLAVCKNLLQQNKVVYIELSEFLLPELQTELTQQFTNLVKFVKIQDIEPNSVYQIPF